MVRYVRIVLIVAVVFTLCSAFSLETIKLFTKKEQKPLYGFGLAVSFTDTVVYYTDIQLLDSARITSDGLLEDRDLYSYQLKDYLEDNALQQNSVCVLFFAKSKKKIEKQAVKVLSKYKTNRSIVVTRLGPEQFFFTKPEGYYD